MSATVLDCHHHQGDIALSLALNRQVDHPEPWNSFTEEEYRQRCGLMSGAGVDEAVLMPVNRYLSADGVAATRRVNDAIAAYRDHDPARFVAAFGVAEPLHGPAGLDEIRRVRDELGLLGISFHARWQGVATNDPWIVAQVELLGELGMIPMIHAHAESNLESPSMVGQVARALPDVPIIVSDAMSSRTNTMHFLDVAHRCPNIYLETSLLYNAAALKQLVAELGAARIVFGSDTYSGRMLTRLTPAVIRGLGLSDDEVDLILHDTMAGLLEQARRGR